MSNSFATGYVNGSIGVGGLVGSIDGGATVENSFWDIETSGQSISQGGIGMNTSEMMNITIFSDADWDMINMPGLNYRNIDHIWNIVDNETYPFLSWEEPAELIWPNTNIVAPDEGEIIDSNEITVVWESYNGSYPIVHHEIQLNDLEPVIIYTDHQYTFHTLEDGHHTIKVTSVDQVMNKFTDIVNITVDTSKPTINIISPVDNGYINVSTVLVEWTGNGGASGIDYYEIRWNETFWVDVGTATSYEYSDREEGPYRVDVRAYDNAGNTNTNSINFTIDLTPPTIEIVAPGEGEHLTNKNVTVEWEGSDELSGMDHYEIRLDLHTGGYWTHWEYMGLNTEHTLQVPEDGEHIVEVRAHDKAGNFYSDIVSFIVDTTKPTVNIVSPVDNAFLQSSTVIVEWTGDGGVSGMDYYEVLLNGSFVSQTTNLVWEFTDLDDGHHTVVVTAYDNAGNSESDIVSFTVDTTEPTITIISPTENAFINSSTVVVEWVGDGGISGIDYYEIRWNENDWISVGTDTTYEFTGMEEGTYEVEVKASDKAGNENSAIVTFTIDLTQPDVNILFPGQGDHIAERNITVEWEGSGGLSGINYYEIRLDVGADGDWNPWIHMGLNTSYEILNLIEGEYIVEITAFDNAGNQVTDTVIFTVDTTPPDILITSPEEGEIFGTDQVTVSWTGSDTGSGIDYYHVWLNGNYIVMKSGHETHHTLTSLEEGINTVEVFAFDKAGNSHRDVVTFMVDLTAPTLVITSPEGGSVFGTGNVNVSWTGSDTGSGISRYEIRLNQGEWVDVGTDTQYSFSLDEGSYVVEVKAHDNAGHNITDDVTFIVDMTSPTVEISSPGEGGVIPSQDVTVSWSGYDDISDISHYEIRLNDGIWMNCGEATTHTFVDLVEGEHEVHVRAFDMAGNCATARVNFTVDLTPPYVNITSPNDGFIFGTGEVAVSWFGYDVITDISYYEIRLNQEDWINIGLHINYTFVDIPEEVNTVFVRAFDMAGHNTIAMVNFTVDLTPPEVHIVSPRDGDIFGTDTVTVSWTGSDGISGISHYEIRLNGGDWENRYLDCNRTFIDLSEGYHTVYVKSYNNAGHNTTVSVNFTVGITPPEVHIVSPRDGDIFGKNTVTVTWAGHDAISGISRYGIRLNEGVWIDVSKDISYTLSDLTEGDHNVTIKAYNNAGHNSTTVVTFTVDLTPPVIVHIPLERHHIDDDIVIDVEVTDNLVLKNVTLYYSYNEISGNLSMENVGGDTFRVVLPAVGMECILEYRIRAIDSAGLISDSEIYLLPVLSLTPPVVTNVSQGGYETMPLNGTLSISFSKPMDTSIEQGMILTVPHANFDMSWIDEHTLNISFYGLSPETMYTIILNESILNDTHGIPIDSFTHSFTTQGPPRIEGVTSVEVVAKGVEIKVQSEIRSCVGLRDVLLVVNDTRGVHHHIYASPGEGELWNAVIPQQNFTGVLTYYFRAVDIGGLIIDCDEFIVNVTNPSWFSPPHNLNPRAGELFEFSIRVFNPVGVIRVMLHYTTSEGMDKSVNLQLEGGNLTDGIWSCRLNIPQGDVSYQIEIIDVYGEEIILPEVPASFSVREKSTLLGGNLLLILLMVTAVCIASGGLYVLWKRRSDEDEIEPDIPPVIEVESSTESKSVEDPYKDRCTICFGKMDERDPNYRCDDCGNSYHKSCIDQVKDCPVCGKVPETNGIDQ